MYHLCHITMPICTCKAINKLTHVRVRLKLSEMFCVDCRNAGKAIKQKTGPK